MKKILLISLLLIIISSCKENNPVNSPDFTSNLFPLKVGNWWRYQIVDSMWNTIDTVRLTIVSENNSSDTIQYKCKLEKNNLIDSLIIYKNEKFVSFSNSHIHYFIDTSYFKLPLSLKSTWGNTERCNYFDSVSEYKINDEILGKHYNTINIFGYFSCYNDYRFPLFKIASNVGIVNYYKKYMGFGNIAINVSLIDYYIK